MNKAFVETEKGIQTAIINYLKYKGWYVQRMNSGRIPIERNGIRRLIMLADKGTPDLMAFKAMNPGFPMNELELLFIEVKRPGKKPTFNQEQMMKELERFGAKCLVVHSIEELEKLL